MLETVQNVLIPTELIVLGLAWHWWLRYPFGRFCERMANSILDFCGRFPLIRRQRASIPKEVERYLSEWYLSWAGSKD